MYLCIPVSVCLCVYYKFVYVKYCNVDNKYNSVRRGCKYMEIDLFICIQWLTISEDLKRVFSMKHSLKYFVML